MVERAGYFELAETFFGNLLVNIYFGFIRAFKMLGNVYKSSNRLSRIPRGKKYVPAKRKTNHR